MEKTLSDIAQQARQMGEPMPNLDKAMADLQANQTDNFQRDMGEATKDIEKLNEMSKSLQQLQQQAQREQSCRAAQFAQADAAQNRCNG